MRLTLSLPTELEAQLAAMAEQHGHEVATRCASAAELAAAIDSGSVELALVATSPRYLSRDLLRVADERGVRLVGVATADPDRRYAAALGLHEVADASSDWTEFEALLRGEEPAQQDQPERSALPARNEEPARAQFGDRSSQRSPFGSGPFSSGARVIVVWGPGGAPGRSSTAIAFASESASLGKRTVLVDADTHGASIAPALGLFDEAPGFAAACRLVDAGRFSQQEFERIAPVHRGRAASFRVLTGIANAGRWPELGEDRVRGVLEALRAWNEVIVVDVAASLERDEELISDIRVPRRNAATITAISEADSVVAIASAEPIGVARLLRQLPELRGIVAAQPTPTMASARSSRDAASSVRTASITVIANRVRSGALGIDAGGEVRRALGRLGGVEPAALLPYDRTAHDAATLAALPLPEASPRSALRRALRDLVERELAPGSRPVYQGMVARWRGGRARPND